MKRDVSINIRVTAEEKKEFLQLAKDSGFGPNLSEFIRQSVLDNNYKKIIKDDLEFTRDSIELTYENMARFVKKEFDDLQILNRHLIGLLEFMFWKEKNGLIKGKYKSPEGERVFNFLREIEKERKIQIETGKDKIRVNSMIVDNKLK